MAKKQTKLEEHGSFFQKMAKRQERLAKGIRKGSKPNKKVRFGPNIVHEIPSRPNPPEWKPNPKVPDQFSIAGWYLKTGPRQDKLKEAGKILVRARRTRPVKKAL